MLNKYKNGFIPIIQKSGFEFERKDNDEKGSTLFHVVNTPFLFQIFQSPDSFDYFYAEYTAFAPDLPNLTTIGDEYVEDPYDLNINKKQRGRILIINY